MKLKNNGHLNKKVISLFLLILFISTATSFAADTYKILSHSNNKYIVQNTATKKTVTVFSKTPLNAASYQDINKAMSFLSKLDSISINKFAIVLSDPLEAKVEPSKIVLQGKNYNSQIPSTISFIFMGKDVQYSFYMSFGKYIVKVKGLYLSENQLANHIQRVSSNPLAYIKSNNPAYLSEQVRDSMNRLSFFEKSYYKRIQSLKSSLKLLRTAYMAYRNGRVIKEKIVKEVLRLKKFNPSLNAEKIVNILEKRKMEVREKEVEIILEVYKNDFSSL